MAVKNEAEIPENCLDNFTDSMGYLNKGLLEWVNVRERNSKSLMSPLIIVAYRIKILRRICLILARRIEGGEMHSETIRILLSRYHGVNIGRYSYGACLAPGLLPPGTSVGNYCSIAEGLRIFRRNHPADFLSQHPFFYNRKLGLLEKDMIEEVKDNPLNIGHDVWVGSNTIILPGCKYIGNGAIVGAGSVVTHDIPPFTIYAGNPARFIRDRFKPELSLLIDKTRWWELSLTDLAKVGSLLITPITQDGLEEILSVLEKNCGAPH